jgi:hypothetical protein
MYTVASYFMKHRYDAQNMIEVDVPLEPMSEYIRAKRGEGKHVTHLAVILAAYLRVAAEFPLLNRFIVNKRAYARNEFAVGMVVLKPGEHDGTMNKMYFELEDDIFEVQSTLSKYVDKNRETGDTNSTDRVISKLLAIPGILTVGVGLFKLLDLLGILPRAIINASPFHASLCISNLGSLGTKHIFHHCYEFGTTSVFITVGMPKDVPQRHGQNVRFERVLPFGVVMDERICSGSYYVKAFTKLKEYLRDPWLLEGPPTFPVVREWAKPGEYEKKKAKKLYKAEKKRIKADTSLSKQEKEKALALAKAALKKAKAEARALKRGQK